MENWKKIVIGAVIVALVGGIYTIWRSDDDQSSIGTTEREEPLLPVTDNSDFGDPEEVEEPNVGEPKKQPQTVTNVLEKPVIYTGYGNSEEKPLGASQTTSTTCETDVNVMCILVFTNNESNEVVEFDAVSTDGNGIARWTWSGSDVGSGAWTVVGFAGDEQSDPGTVYIN